MPSSGVPSYVPLVAQICLHTGSGGAERYLLSLARELATRRPVLIVTVRESWLESEARAAGLETATIPQPSGPLSLTTVSRLSHVLRSRKAKILHSHLGISDWYTWLAAHLVRKTALLSTEHGISADRPELFARTSLGQFVRRVAHRQRLRSTDAVVAVSNHTAEALRVRYGLRATRSVVTIYPGIDLERFSQRRGTAFGNSQKPLRLVYVGRMEEEKGPDILLEAMRLCASLGLKLVLTIVGEGSLRPQLQDDMQPQQGIEIRWVGQAADPTPFLQDADVFVLPSRSENLPLAVVEAMAAGLPVIAADVGGVAEVVQDGKTGLLVGPEDSSGLALAIERCSRERKMLSEMGTKGHIRSRDFDIRRVADSISGLYDRVLLGKQIPTRGEESL